MSDEYYATACTDRYGLLKGFSKENKRNSTDAEKELWAHIKANKLGVKFRRQHPILDFIADFICLSEQLIIEVDGGYHSEEEQIIQDKMRDERLADMGYTILRYKNEDVINNLDFVLTDIQKNIKNNEYE